MKIKKFKTSQWIMAIIIICLLQLLIHYYSVQVMSGSEVINYVSFAGTIVSIILAVLAIVYSFYQSFTQQNNVDSIAREVEKLKKTAKSINESSDLIGTAAECLPKMLRELESLPTIVSTSVASQIKEQTGVLLGDHATDLKSFMADSISKSAGIFMSGNSLNPIDETEDKDEDEDEDGLQLNAAELITVICAASAYMIVTGCDFTTSSRKWEAIFDIRTHQAVISGISSINIALIMTGDVTIDTAKRTVRVNSVQDEYSGVGGFVTYALKDLRDYKADNEFLMNRVVEEFSEIPQNDHEVLKMINRFIPSNENKKS